MAGGSAARQRQARVAETERANPCQVDVLRLILPAVLHIIWPLACGNVETGDTQECKN